MPDEHFLASVASELLGQGNGPVAQLALWKQAKHHMLSVVPWRKTLLQEVEKATGNPRERAACERPFGGAWSGYSIGGASLENFERTYMMWKQSVVSLQTCQKLPKTTNVISVNIRYPEVNQDRLIRAQRPQGVPPERIW